MDRLADALLVWVDSPRPVKPWFRVESLVNGCVERELPSLRGRKVGSGRQRAQVPLVPSSLTAKKRTPRLSSASLRRPSAGRHCAYHPRVRLRTRGRRGSKPGDAHPEIVVNRERFAIEGRCALEIAA